MAESAIVYAVIDTRKVYSIYYVDSGYFYASPRPFVPTQTIITNLNLDAEVGDMGYRLDDITQLMNEAGNSQDTAFTKIKDKIRALGNGFTFSSNEKTWSEVDSEFQSANANTSNSNNTSTQGGTSTGTTIPPPPPPNPVPVGMGNTLSIPMDIDASSNSFTNSVYGVDKLDPLSKKEVKDKIPNGKGEIPGDPSVKSTGGVKTMLELITRMQVKIVGFFCESFIIAMKPATKLKEMILEQDNSENNTGETIYSGLPESVKTVIEPATKNMGEIPALLASIPLLIASAANPAALAQLTGSLNKLKDKLAQKMKDQAKEVKSAGDLMGEMSKFISKPQEAVSGLLTKSLVPGVPAPLENFTIPLPAISLGLISIPKIDKKEFLSSKPFQHPQIMAFVLTSSMLANPIANKIVLSNLITDPMGELKKVIPNPPNITNPISGGTDVDLGDTQFTLDITNTGLSWQQFTFIDKIPAYEANDILSKFYKEDVALDPTDTYNKRKRYDGFDFFQPIESPNDSISGKTMWDLIVDSWLDIDTDFMKEFYNALSVNPEYQKNRELYKVYEENTISPLGRELLKEIIFPHLNFEDVYGNDADAMAQLFGVSNDAREIFKRNFNLSFSLLISEDTGPDAERFNCWTKEFKLRFWRIIPKEVLDNFSPFQTDFSTVMSKAYSDTVGLLNYTEDGSAFVNADFVDNYNQAVGEDGPILKGPKGTPLIPNISFASLGALMAGLTLPAQAKWIFSIVDLFIGSATMFFNVATGFLKDLFAIVKDIITMKISEFIKKIKELLSTLTDPLGFVAILMGLLIPIILPLLTPLLAKYGLDPSKIDIQSMLSNIGKPNNPQTTEQSGSTNTTETTGSTSDIESSGSTNISGAVIAGAAVGGAAVAGAAILGAKNVPGMDAIKAFITKIIDAVKAFVKMLTENFMKMIESMIEMSGVSKLVPIPPIPPLPPL